MSCCHGREEANNQEKVWNNAIKIEHKMVMVMAVVTIDVRGRNTPMKVHVEEKVTEN